MWQQSFQRVSQPYRFGLTKKPAKDKLSKTQEQYLRPKNCTMLLAPRVNPKLWEDLSDTARMRDIGLQNLQKSFVKACYPIIKLENTAVLPKTKGSDQIPTEDIYKSLVDVVTLLGNALYDFSMKWRELLKTEVAAGYKSVPRKPAHILIVIW